MECAVLIDDCATLLEGTQTDSPDEEDQAVVHSETPSPGLLPAEQPLPHPYQHGEAALPVRVTAACF